MTVLVDAHSLAVFKRGNRTEGNRAGARDGDRKARESGVYQQAARSIWGEEYVQSREPSLSLRTCVHPCLSAKNIVSGGHRRASPRLDPSTYNVTRQKFQLQRIEINKQTVENLTEINLYKMISPKFFLTLLRFGSSRYIFRRNVSIRNIL